MKFTNDIYFNDELRSGKEATITYSGSLFKTGSENVNLVFGFGENWDYTTTLPMQKNENGFTTNVEMKDYGIFNFCFSNENNIWDNNYNSNYISPILPKTNEEDITFGTDYSSAIDNIIEDILGNTVQNEIINSQEENNINNILESIQKESIPEIEELFSELFSQEYDYDNKISNIENDIKKQVSEQTTNEILALFDELFSNIETEPSVSEETTIDVAMAQEASFNLDGLVEEILNPVINATVSAPSTDLDKEISLFDDIKDHENDELETSLTVVDSNKFLVSSRRLGAFYSFKKRLKLALYKVFIKIPKELIRQLGFGEN